MTETNLIQSLLYYNAELFLLAATFVLMMVGVVMKHRSLQRTAIIAVTALFVTLVVVMQQDNSGTASYLFNGMIVLDRFGVFMKVLILASAIASIFIGVRDLAGQVIGRFEYTLLIMLATIGMMVMISANNLLSLYMGLELQSLSLYILAAFNRNSLQSSEAGLKYFILGALSSGLLLFGISLVYGYTGTTDYTLIAQSIADFDQASAALIVAMVFILIGIAFKISAVPFHMWTPDVYEGAPACVTAFFAVAPKIAALAMLARFLNGALADMQADWMQILYALSLLSMALGAFAGLVQKNIYRLMAYSSIGHMGYVLLGYMSGEAEGLTASLVYVTLYAVMTAGMFAFMLSVRKPDDMAASEIADFSGLSTLSPKVSYGMAALLFSLAGIPPLSGFFGKLFVFQAALNAGMPILATIGVLTSVVAAYYYLVIIKTMFFDKPAGKDAVFIDNGLLLKLVAYPSLIFTITYILFPNWLVYEAGQAAQSLIR